MSDLQTIFRQDTMSGIFNLTSKVWLPVTVAYVITSILTMLLIAPILLNVFGFDLTMLQDLTSGADPEAQLERMMDMMEGVKERFLEPTNLAMFAGAMLLTIVVSMYVANVAFIANEAKVKEDPMSMGKILATAFNSDILRLFVVYVIIILATTLAYLALVAVVGVIDSMLNLTFLNVVLGLVGFGLVMIFSYKFILAFPAIVHGEMGIGEAVAYSFKTVTWRKACKYFLISIVALIALLVAGGILTIFQGLLAIIPVIGVVVSQLAGMVISGFFSAFIYSCFSALYYKRVEDIELEDNLDDHLILDN